MDYERQYIRLHLIAVVRVAAFTRALRHAADSRPLSCQTSVPSGA